jgi:hypothetical protein
VPIRCAVNAIARCFRFSSDGRIIRNSPCCSFVVAVIRLRRKEIPTKTQLLHNLGQSIWVDNITLDLLDSGTLQLYIDEVPGTGLTSNPTIFDQAFTHLALISAAFNLDRVLGSRSSS